MPHTDSFESLLLSFGRSRDLHRVFDDFLTIVLTSFAQKPGAGVSYQEDEYLTTLRPYAKEEVALFPKVLATLVEEMELRCSDLQGNDVLGEFYETHIASKQLSQIFTPPQVCAFIAMLHSVPEGTKARVYDPACGSGRLGLAFARVHGSQHRFYAVDIDLRCVKMTAINYFLNGIFGAEILCANALDPSSFTVCYRTSMVPFGVFRIDDPEDSVLWRVRQTVVDTMEAPHPTGFPQLKMF